MIPRWGIISADGGQTADGGQASEPRSGRRAGGVAAAVWALQEPVDRRIFRSDYSDVAILGKAVTGGRRWWLAGTALHVANGMLFGLAYHEVRRRRAVDPRVLALAMALGEHLALYPLGGLVDRFHPRRGTPGIRR